MSDQLSIALRPRLFSRIVGQPIATRLLQNMIAKSYLPRCILLIGSCGTGKTSLARLFAALVNCDSRGEGLEPCGTCYHCVSIFDSTSSIVIECESAVQRKVEDLDAVRQLVSYSVPESKRRIIICDEFHCLSDTAQESLLHLLEANSLDTTFVLTTTQPNSIDDAVMSRAFPIALSSILPEDRQAIVAQYFRDSNLVVEPEVIALVSQAEFGLRSVWQLVDKLRLEFGDKPVTFAGAQEVLGLLAGTRLESLITATKRNLLAVVSQGQTLQKSGCQWSDLVGALFSFAEDELILHETGEIRLTSGVSEKFFASMTWSKSDCLAILGSYFELVKLDWKTGLPRLYTIFRTVPTERVESSPVIGLPKVQAKATKEELLNADPVWAAIGKKFNKRIVECA